MVKRIAAVVFFLLIVIWPRSVFAEGEFATSYDVLYDVSEDGITTVTEKISLKNRTSESYASQFKLTISATQIFDIKASDPSGPLEVSTGQKDTATTIAVKFNQQVAGLGKILPWTLTFKSKDFAEKSGKVWEVRAPKISPSSNLESYNLTISVPQNFGDLSAVSPLPKNQSLSSSKIFLTFDMNQLRTSGVFASFGTSQLFDFDLAYHLWNSNLMPILTSVALPPDTSFQDVIFQRIDPKPLNVTVDQDGNYLAWYRLTRGQKVDVRVLGSAKLYASSKVKNPSLPENLRKKYTAGDKYWEKDNPQIVSQLNEILKENPSADNRVKTKLIFQFVVDTLKYDSERLTDNIERLGAVTALANPDKAICMEFTDLFIALSRAAGIPARELDGYAHTSNTTLRPLSFTKDILHAWPQYWDEQRGWVMVDPTWQNTTGGVDYFSKLDLNHFVFVLRGSSSSDPIPAGSYKYAGQSSNDVKVTLSENDFLGKPQLDVEVLSANPVFSGFPGSLRIKVTNSGNGFYPSAPLSITTDKLVVLDADKGMSGLIPAYGTATFDFNLRTRSLFDSYDDTVTILIGRQKFTKNIIVRPFLLFQPIPMMIGIVAAFMIFIYLSILGIHIYRGRISKNKKK